MGARNFFDEQYQFDLSLGLMMRLNILLTKIETDIERGEIESWNMRIDRIYSNILYKKEAVVIKDENEDVIDYKLSKEDTQIFNLFNKRIYELQKLLIEAKKEPNVFLIKDLNRQIYSTIAKKDVWVRKLMFTLKLYLRNNEKDPSRAIFGG